MEDHHARALAPYGIEIANILYFLKEPRTVSQWQDWLWKRMPKLKAVTTKVPPYTPRIGRWGANDIPDKAVLHTDLLTLLVKSGQVTRTRHPHTVIYQTKTSPLDTAAKPSYKVEEVF